MARALEKTSELRKQNGLPVSIESEGDIEKVAEWLAQAVVAAYPTTRFPDADELIAATSVAHDVPLVTREARIRRSRRVPIAR